MIGVIVWLAMIVLSPIISFFCVPKPFSKVQKIGLLVSVLALVAILLLPVVSIAGIMSFNFLDTMKWMTEQRGADEKELFEYFIPLLLAWFVSAPLISATLYMSNVAKRVGGLLMIVPPLYLVILGHISSFLERAGLASGSIAYLLCAILLIILPWIIKESREQPQEKKRLRIIVPVIVAFIGLAPAIFTQVMAGMERHSGIGARNEEDSDSTDVVEEVIAVEAEENSNEVWVDWNEYCAPEESFVEGISRIVKYNSRSFETGKYLYKSKHKCIIRISNYKDNNASIDTDDCETELWVLNLGSLCDVIDIEDSNTEFICGQADIDGDGIDELIIAGRTTHEKENRICVNVYDMSRYWEVGFPVKSIYNETTYANMGIAFIEPDNGERNGRITICEGETMDLDHMEIWYLQDDFEWIQ